VVYRSSREGFEVGKGEARIFVILNQLGHVSNSEGYGDFDVQYDHAENIRMRK
jgi:hypothetical protein